MYVFKLSRYIEKSAYLFELTDNVVDLGRAEPDSTRVQGSIRPSWAREKILNSLIAKVSVPVFEVKSDQVFKNLVGSGLQNLSDPDPIFKFFLVLCLIKALSIFI